MNNNQLTDAERNIFLNESNWQGVSFEVQTPAEIFEYSGAQEEYVTEHVCPLCESYLEEEIDEDRMIEHTQEVLETFEAVAEVLAEAAEDSDEE